MIRRKGDMSSESFQKRLEAKNQVFDNIDQLMKRWEQRITIRNLRLFERFINLELDLIFRFSTENPAEMRLACLHHKCVPIASKGMNPGSRKDGVPVNSEEESVLVDVIKFVESPEKIVPASIRFEVINSFFRLRPHTLYFSSLVPFVSGEIFGNRERGILCGLDSIYEPQLICKVIERTPEVLANVPSDSDSVKRKHSETMQLIRAINGGMRIVFTQSYVCVYVPASGENFPLKIHEVLLGPLNFYADQNKSALGI
jgi:hypothetical protein